MYLGTDVFDGLAVSRLPVPAELHRTLIGVCVRERERESV